MSKQRPLVYISYRWRGAKKFADRLSKELVDDKDLGIDVFQDSLSLKSLRRPF